MDHLDGEIRRLGEEIRAVEEMLVEAYGLAPVTPAITVDLGSAWVHRLGEWCQRARQSLASLMGSGNMLPVRAPQPD